MKLKPFIILGTGLLTIMALGQSAQSQTSGLKLKSPEIKQTIERVRCKAEGVIETGYGTAIRCKAQNGKEALLIAGRNNDRALTFGLAMVSDDTKPYRYFLIDGITSKEQLACNHARKLSFVQSCFRMIAMQMSVKDSPVNVGDASPGDWPNIPTGDANPNSIPVPTGDARPD